LPRAADLPAWIAAAALLASSGAAAAGERLESITVTARKVEQDLQVTGEAVSALDGAELARRDIDELAGIGGLIPNLRLENAPGTGNTAAVTIRGISQPDPLITGDPSVGIYSDGIYTARLVSADFALFDVDRVEILRGPQGTLYGKNTPAGAINLWSRRPDGALGGYLRGTAGSDRRSDLEAALGFPILSERLSGRIALLSRNDDGYVDNHSAAGVTSGVGAGIGDRNGRGARGSLLWNPVADVEILATGYRYRERRDAGFPNQVAFADHASIDTSPSFLLIDPDEFDTAAWAAFNAAADADDAYLSFRGRQDLDVTGTSVRAKREFGTADLRYTFGYREYQFRNAMDLDGSPFTLFHIGSPDDPQDEKSRQASHELTASGTALGEALGYTGGLYFFDERSSSAASQYFGATTFGPMRSFGEVVSRIRSWAAYAQTSYALSERLALVLGLRHTQERREMLRQLEGGVPLFDGSPDLLQRPDWSKRWKATTWLASLELEATDDLFLYAKAGTGYRSGGWNGRGSFVEELEVPFDEESVTSYELGAKRDWLESRLRTNLALFYQKYEDIQVTDSVPSGTRFVTLILNAGDADVQGGELEVQARPIPELTLGGSLGWNWFRFDDGSDHQENDPAFTYALSGEYAFPPVALGEVSARLDFRYQSRNFADGDVVTSNFGVLGGRIGLELPSGIELALIGTNLLDREYFTAGVDFVPYNFGYRTRSWAPGRRLALELGWRFGEAAR
jgi:iron complex outermembrane receptor protein